MANHLAVFYSIVISTIWNIKNYYLPMFYALPFRYVKNWMEFINCLFFQEEVRHPSTTRRTSMNTSVLFISNYFQWTTNLWMWKVRILMQILLTIVPKLECGLLCHGTVGSVILQKPAASIFKLPKFRNNSLPLSTVNQHFGRNCCVHLECTKIMEGHVVCIFKVPTLWRNPLPSSPRYQ